ncbi:MAG: serine/threonine protein kinase [Candidatus Obscuribacterales bacterium]|jgi:serine/threonine protein kinase|nr:serine/threonine protein kinase [Candidatus Obscuribacterales bacterium]
MEIELAPGSIFDKNYEILSVIGSGGMGTVYKARQKGLDRIVALKLLKLDQVKEHESLSRFEREAKSLSTLLNKHIARFYSYGKDESGLYYIAMEYLEGKSLRQILIEENSINWRRAVHICKQICTAMHAAHEQGTINRDLKPENIILQQEPQKDFVKIIDFGLAKLVADEDQRNEGALTRTGELVGTVHYLSPEQCRGKAADERSDVYSLGCILFEMLFGQAPFDAENPIGILHKHASEEISFPPDSKIELTLKKVIRKATAKAPERRYQSMADFQNDLQLFESGKGDLATAQDEADPDKLQTRKTIARFAGPIAFVLLGVALTGTSIALWIYNTDEGKVIQARISLISPSEDKRRRWLAEADKLEARADKKHASSIIDSVRESYGPDAFAFLRLQNIHARSLLENNSKDEASKWAWRTIAAIEKDTSPKSEANREFYNNLLDDSADIILAADRPLTKQQIRTFLAIVRDRTGKFRHYNEKDSLTALAFKIVLESNQNLGKEISEALVFHVQKVARKSTITRAIKLLPILRTKFFALYGKVTATYELVRVYLNVAKAATEAGREDIATALISKAEDLLKIQATDGLDSDLCNAYTSLAENYRKLGKIKKAEDLGRQSIRMAADEVQKAASLLELATTYACMGNQKEIATLSKEAVGLTHTDSTPGSFSIGVSAVSNLAKALTSMGKPDEALKELSNHLAYLQTFNDQKHAPYIFSVLLARARTYCFQKKHQLAEIDFLSAAKLIQEQNLGTESQSTLIRLQLSCALGSKDTNQIKYVLDELQNLRGKNIAIAIKATDLRDLRTLHNELADRVVAHLEQQELSAQKDKGEYAHEARMITSILLAADERTAAKRVIDRALKSGLVFEGNRQWFKVKASLLESKEPSEKELKRDLLLTD